MKLQWKQTDTSDRFTFPTNAVGYYYYYYYCYYYSYYYRRI